MYNIKILILNKKNENLMSKLEITEKVIIQYDITLEIPTKYGLISDHFKDVDSCRKPLADNSVDF